MTQIPNIIGKKFNLFTVLQYTYYNHKNKQHYWKCKCKCGHIKNVSYIRLLNKSVVSCGSINHKINIKKVLSQTLFHKYKYNAIRRDLTFKITIKQAWNKFEKQNGKCALSGRELSFGNFCEDINRTASLDRIDSTKGYSVDNIQWVHKDINQMKWNMPQEEFIDLCAKVVSHLNLKTEKDIDDFIANLQKEKENQF